MRLRVVVFCAALTVLFAAIGASAATFAGGTGEPNDPYRIATAEQLIGIGSDPNLLDKCFILVSDIDMYPNLPGRQVFDRPLIARGTGRASYDSDFRGIPFTGRFDGQGHRIANLMFMQGGYSYLGFGLFGEIGQTGTVQDLRLERVVIDGQDGFDCGTMAVSNRGTILRCRVGGYIVSAKCVGGLVGFNYGTISQCRSDCIVSAAPSYYGGLSLGGLVGCNESGMVTDCYATGDVSGTHDDDSAGGLVGSANGGIISRCYSTGSVSGAYSGGLAAVWLNNHASLRHSFWDIDTTGQPWSEGGYGRTTAQMKRAATFIGWGPEWTIQEGKDRPRLAWEYAAGVPLQNHPARTYAGRGDANEPFVLQKAADLLCLMARSEDWACAFELTGDIDLMGVPFLPIADFTGSFDGKGHHIAHLAIHENSIHLALIGCLDGGVVQNLTLTDVDIRGDGAYVGALVGMNTAGRIVNCSVTGAITGKTVEGRVLWHGPSMGGLVATNSQGFISGCSTTVKATGGAFFFAGGLVGVNDGYVSCSRATANIAVDGVTGEAGGFVASNAGNITNCLAGGRVALNAHETETRDDVHHYVSGFAGSNGGGIVNCYTCARISRGDPNCTKSAGFVAYPSVYGSVLNCFWDEQMSGRVGEGEGTGLTTAQMQQLETYIDADWDFVEEPTNGTSDLWFMPPEGGYPELVAFLPNHKAFALTGHGTSEDPYRVRTARELGMVRHGDHTAYYQLSANIDLPQITWAEPPIPEFDGHFDGGGHVLSGLTIRGTTHLGLFGRLGSRAVVANLGVQEASVSGKSATCLGCLAGINNGTIANCWSVGEVRGQDDSERLGGLVGENSGEIMDCHVTGAISAGHASGAIGGLAGASSGKLLRCASITTVWVSSQRDVSIGSTSWDVAGLVGSNGGTITNCVATGCVCLTDDGGGDLGGLAGWSGGPIEDCIAAVDVICTTGGGYIGGLIGRSGCNASGSCATGVVFVGVDSWRVGGLVGAVQQGRVTDCYATSSVSGGSTIGGLIGLHDGTLVERCYAAGGVSGLDHVGGLIGDGSGPVSSCFWDTAVTGQSRSQGGVGKTTTEMQRAETFKAAGWDFDHVWTIEEGSDYPRLRWE